MVVADKDMSIFMDREFLRSLIEYNQETGDFTWKVKRNGGSGIVPGTKFGHKHDKGDGRVYMRGCIAGKAIYLHRLAFILMGEELPFSVDHINGNTLDNRWINLAQTTHSENLMNRKLSSNNKSGCHGVHFDSACGKWRVRICKDGNLKSFGVFKNLGDAKKAAAKAYIELGFGIMHGRVSG